MCTQIGKPRSVPAGTTATGNPPIEYGLDVGPRQVGLEWAVVAGPPAVQRRRPGRHRGDDDVEATDKRLESRSKRAPVAQEGEEALGRKRVAVQVVEEPAHLLGVAAARWGEIRPSPGTAVRGHHPEEELGRFLE